MTTTEFVRNFQSIESTLFAFALKITRNHQDALDLVQEAGLKGFRHRDRFELGTNFRAWMSTILRNTFINQYRKQRRAKIVSEPVENLAYALESSSSIPNQGEVNMGVKDIQEMLNALTPTYRVPFLMHFQGYEYQEIADHLEIPIGTVKSRLHEARKKLQRMVDSRK
ncbi:MAG TPA: RNA polymerase sigma factor [Flavilitoribacter sp.]|nr:RNA polymerase sigma factor [Flavilitoribacter sp.]HMQ89612.1 RNA polymerase sigma factor [Flavilitoribacter sp.]